jgi:hypothetical protein
MSSNPSSAASLVPRRPVPTGDPVDPPGSALDAPGSTRVSCLLMDDVVVSDAPSVLSPYPDFVNRRVGLFSNPFRNGQEEALVVDSARQLTYLERVDSTTGWTQTRVATAQDEDEVEAAVEARAVGLPEVVVVVHPRDLSIWAIYVSGTGGPQALRLVADVKDGVTTCTWVAMPGSIQFRPGDNLSYVTNMTVTYDGRNPCIGASGMTGPDGFALMVISPMISGDGNPMFTSITAPVSTCPSELIARRPRKTGSSTLAVFYYLTGTGKLQCYDFQTGTTKLVASNARRLVGAFPSSATGGVGCLYLDSSSLIAAYRYSGHDGFLFSETPGLDYYSATAWIDANDMVHVYGIDLHDSLKVLHQKSWGPLGRPVWSESAGTLEPSKKPVTVPACVGLVPDVTSFVLDSFPDQFPSQFVQTGLPEKHTDQYAFYTQDINSARWSQDTVRLPSTATPHVAAGYTSTVTVLDRRGTPMPGLTVRISAESLAEVRVDGVSYLVGPGSTAAVSTNAHGKVVISSPADSLVPAVLHVDAAGLQNGAVIQPAAAVHSYLAGTGTLPSQQGKFTEDALRDSGIVQPGHGGSVGGVVKGARQAFTLAEGKTPTSLLYTGDGPAPAIHGGFVVGPRPGAALNEHGVQVVEYQEFATAEELAAYHHAVQALPNYGGVWQDFANWADDVWQGVKNGAIEVYDVVVDLATGMAAVAIKIGDAVVRLAGVLIDSIQSAARVVESYFREVVTEIGKVVDWLKSLFAFKDIWDTKKALAAGSRRILVDYGLETVNHFDILVDGWITKQKAAAGKYFENLKKDYAGRPLGDAGNQLPPVTDASGAALSSAAVRDDPRAGWLLQQATSPATLAATSWFGADEETPAAIAAVADAWDVLLQAIEKNGVVNAAQAAFDHLADLAATIADPADPAGVPKSSMTAVIDALEKLIGLAFDALGALMDAIVLFARTVANGLDAMLALPLPQFGPLNALYTWIQGQAKVAEPEIEQLTVGGLAFLIAAFPVTIGYKLLNGVDRSPFPNGVFPRIAAPKWHRDHDPAHVIGADPQENENLRILQGACGLAGLGATLSGLAADIAPLSKIFAEDAFALDMATGVSSTVLGSIMFGAVASCPPVTGTDWMAAGGKWAVAFEVSVITVFANMAQIATAIRDQNDPAKKATTTSVLRNIKDAVWGPILTTFLGIGYLVPSGMACTEDKTNPYTTTMILLSGVSNATQVARVGLGPISAADKVRGGVIAGVNVLANGASAAMLYRAAELAVPVISKAQTLASGRIGMPYEQKVKAVDGDYVFNRPLKGWTVVDGKLPAGLNLDATTGVISGIPTQAIEKASFSLQCHDSFGPPQYTTPTPLWIKIEG